MRLPTIYLLWLGSTAPGKKPALTCLLSFLLLIVGFYSHASSNAPIPSCFISAAVTVDSNTTCLAATGQLTAAGSNGVSPYSYAWSNGSTSATIAGLSANSYTVTVSDAAGCTAVIEATPEAHVSLDSASCANQITGFSDTLWATTIAGAIGYAFEISSENGFITTVQSLAGMPSNALVLDSVPGIQLDSSYAIRVAAIFGTCTGSYGAACAVSTPSFAADGSQLFWVDEQTGLLTTAAANGAAQQVVLHADSLPQQLVADPEGGYLYMARWYSSTISRTNLDGSNFTNLISTTLSPTGLAIDRVGGKMYWTERSWNTGSIHSANLDGSNYSAVTGGFGSVYDLAFDEAGRYLYWTSWADNVICRIHVSNYSVIDTLVDRSMHRMGLGALAIDTVRDQLYFTGRLTDALYRCELDGSNITQIATDIDPNYMVFDPGVRRLYYTTRHEVMALDVDGINPTKYTLASGLTLGRGIALLPPTCPFTVHVSTSSTTNCTGSTGALAAIPYGGAAPFSYSWSHGGNAATAAGLATGSYTVTTTDAAGCSAIGVGETAPTTQLNAGLCGLVLDSSAQQLLADAVAGAVSYEFEITSLNGFYALASSFAGHLPNALILDSVPGIAFDSTYHVRVRPIFAGCAGSYGSSCTITTPLFNPNGSRLFWGSNDLEGIYTSLGNAGSTTTKIAALSDANFLAVDTINKTIYWADHGPDCIKRSNFDGSNDTTVVDGLGHPFGVAVNHATGRIFWSDLSDDLIGSANLDGSDQQHIITDLDDVRGIAIDEVRQRIYWLDDDQQHLCSADPTGLNSNIDTVWQRTCESVNLEGVAIDPYQGHIYIGDGILDRVIRINLDGSNQIDFMTELEVEFVSPYQLAIDLNARQLYLADAGGDRVVRADLDGSNRNYQVVADGLGRPYGLAVATSLCPYNVHINTDSTTSCTGTSGALSAIPLGGNAPHTYVWSNGASSAGISGLAGGSYTVTVTDASGCSAIGTQSSMHQSLVSADQCDGIIATTDTLFATTVTGATGYQFSIAGQAGFQATVTPSTAPLNALVLDNVAGIEFDQTYTIEVAPVFGGCAGAPGRSCQISIPPFNPNGGQLFWGATTSTTTTLSRGYNNARADTILVTNAGQADLMALDTLHHHIFRWDLSFDQISRCNFDGSGDTVIVSNINICHSLEVDHATNTLYWEYQDTIMRSNLDGSSPIAWAAPGINISGFAIDETARHLYWYNRDDRSICRTNIDSSAFNFVTVVDLLALGFFSTQDIEIDPSAGKIYFSESAADVVFRCNMDGSNLETVITDMSLPKQLAIDVSARRIYVSDPNDDVIYVADLDGTDQNKAVLAVCNRSMGGIAVMPGNSTGGAGLCNSNNIPTTRLRNADCGLTLDSINQQICAEPVPNAQWYQLEISDSTFTDTIDALQVVPAPIFSLNSVAGVGYNSSYAVRVRANVHGCWGAFDSACSVTTPVAVFAASAVVKRHVGCNGVCLGSLSTTTTGGVAPYSYVWSNGTTAALSTGLATGTYTVTIADFHGATATASTAITQQLETPENLRAWNPQDSSVTLQWDTVCGAQGYRIRYKLAGASSWSVVFKSGNHSQRQITGLLPNSSYRWNVSARCNGAWSAPAAVQLFSTLSAPCVSPGGLSTAPVQFFQARANWNPVPNVLRYKLRWRQQGATSWTTLLKDSLWTKHWLTGLSANTTYEWAIRAQCELNNSGTPWSAVQTFTTPPSNKMAAPIGSNAANTARDVSLVPNPTTGKFQVRLNQWDGPVTITVVDPLGRIVAHKRKMHTTTVEIALDAHTKGVYFVGVASDQERVWKRLLVTD